MQFLVAIGFLVVLLMGPVTTASADDVRYFDDIIAEGATQLTGEEIQKLIVGNTITIDNPRLGYKIRVYIDLKGVRRYTYRGDYLSQKWWIKDDMRCFESMRGGTPCSKFLREANGAIRICEDRHRFGCEADITIEPGNPDRL